MQTAQTAAEAFERFHAAREAGLLTQNAWHKTASDGRQLACALGVLGPDVEGPFACPAAVMPRWLAQMVPTFFDGMDFDAAVAWGERFYAELARLDGKVPFSVIHDWQANVVCPLGVEWREFRKISVEAVLKVKGLHERALTGDRAPRAEWREALHPMHRERYANADANADAYADAYANANADAYANANANADANAYANAYANANADANAYANADANADADAYANADADAKKTRRQDAIARLANGMVECLARVS